MIYLIFFDVCSLPKQEIETLFRGICLAVVKPFANYSVFKCGFHAGLLCIALQATTLVQPWPNKLHWKKQRLLWIQKLDYQITQEPLFACLDWPITELVSFLYGITCGFLCLDTSKVCFVPAELVDGGVLPSTEGNPLTSTCLCLSSVWILSLMALLHKWIRKTHTNSNHRLHICIFPQISVQFGLLCCSSFQLIFSAGLHCAFFPAFFFLLFFFNETRKHLFKWMGCLTCFIVTDSTFSVFQTDTYVERVCIYAVGIWRACIRYLKCSVLAAETGSCLPATSCASCLMLVSQCLQMFPPPALLGRPLFWTPEVASKRTCA